MRRHEAVGIIDDAHAAILGLRQASIKRLINFSCERTLPEHLKAEASAFLAAADTDDFAEGVRAFLEKRTPRFGQPAPA